MPKKTIYLLSLHKVTIYLLKKESNNIPTITAQKMKFSIKDFFNKCDQIRSFLRI